MSKQPFQIVSRRRLLELFIWYSVLSLTLILSHMHLGISQFSEDPAKRVSEAARSLINHGTISAPEFMQCYIEAREYSRSVAGAVWQDCFSVSPDGQLFPKHAIGSAFLSAPFYFLFGEWGFLIVGYLSGLVIVLSLYVLCQRFFRRDYLLLLLVFAFVFVPQPAFSFRFYPDLQAVAVLLTGLALLERTPFLGTLLMTCTYFFRPSNLLLALPLCFVGCPNRKSFENAGLWIGLSLGASLIAISNYYLWGDFLSTSYHHIIYFDAGIPKHQEHAMGLDPVIFRENLYPNLFSQDKGIFVQNPFLCLLALFPFVFSRSDQKRFFSVLVSAMVIYMLFVFSYQHQREVMRLLNPVFFLGILPIFQVFEGLLNGRSIKKRES